MKFKVHTEAVLATNDVGAVVVKETALVVVAAVRVGAVPVGLTRAVSFEVETLNVERTSVVPFTTPIVSEAAVEFARAHVFAPLLESVTVIMLAFVGSDAVAEQFAGNDDGVIKTTAGVVEIVVKPVGKASCMVAPAASEPVDDVVNPQVHVEAAPLTSEVGAVADTVAEVTEVAVMVAPPLGLSGVVSAEV